MLKRMLGISHKECGGVRCACGKIPANMCPWKLLSPENRCFPCNVLQHRGSWHRWFYENPAIFCENLNFLINVFCFKQTEISIQCDSSWQRDLHKFPLSSSKLFFVRHLFIEKRFINEKCNKFNLFLNLISSSLDPLAVWSYDCPYLFICQ